MRGFFGVLDFFCILSVVVITRIYTSVETQRTVTAKSKFYCTYIEKLKKKGITMIDPGRLQLFLFSMIQLFLYYQHDCLPHLCTT